MGTITAGIIAVVAGIGLASATLVGVVHAEQHSGTKTVAHTVDYGKNS